MPDTALRREPDRRRSARSLAVLLGVLVVAALLRVDTGSATLFGVAGPACPLGAALGTAACPGCGLTRSTALIAHGRLADAFALHAGGFVVLLACLGGLLVHGHVLATGRRTIRHDALLRAGRVAFVAGLLAAWAARIVLPAT